MKKLFAILILAPLLAQSLFAASPRLTNGINLGAGHNQQPCTTTTACNANVGQEILYERPTGTGGCNQMWSVDAAGDNSSRVNMSANLIANGGILLSGVQQITTSLNNGAPQYDSTGAYVLFSAQAVGSGSCAAPRTPGQGVYNNFGVCTVASFVMGNTPSCAIIGTPTVCPTGCLRPKISNDGTTIFWGSVHAGTGGSPWNYTTCLNWATVTFGSPSTLGTPHGDVDPQGAGTPCTQSFYEPWDSNGWGGTTSVFYYQTTMIPNQAFGALQYLGIGWYNIATGATGIISPAYGPGGVTALATQATPGSTTVTVASASGTITSGMIATGNGFESTPILTEVTNVSGSTVTISSGTTAAMSSTPVLFYNPCYSEFYAINPQNHDVALTDTGCGLTTVTVTQPAACNMYTGGPGYEVLDIAMVQAVSGQGFNQLTYYNVPGTPEYYTQPVETSTPAWGLNGSYITFNRCGNCTLQCQIQGFPESGIVGDLWKYTIVNTPDQMEGLQKVTGKSAVK